MKAKDLMIPIQDYLRPDNTLKEAVNLLKTAKRGEDRIGVKGLPVLDEKGRLIGMLSMRDILKVVFPFYMSMMDLGDFTWDGMVESIARRSSDKLVKDVMSKVIITVDENASLMECVDHMIKHNIKRLPVVDKSGKAVGMLYERDVFFAIIKAMLEENNGDRK
ncbi:CBS domain-containing protein [Dissulfurispira thermophila]|uniref:CBS domain-containing protein n=2 Tax=root TaxID=1 RepID=A0A7G1H255_9BACT|nr:CBS domain-containing protein [Dissulfurispira thermophila]BCB96860.1 CBS domain-containing protein [Dissulfurispira thermophila]